MTERPEKSRAYAYAAICCAVLVAYGISIGNRFVWDDLTIILKNPFLEHFSSLPRVLLMEDRTADGPTGYYRPVTYLSFLIDRTLWGDNPVGFNITNIALHLAASLLLFRVVLALFGEQVLALTAALLFALHPVAAEAVNFHAGGRNTLLCATFALLALFSHIRGWRIAAVLSCTAAIFSKEFGLLVPAALFMYDRFLAPEKKKLWNYLPFAAVMAVYLVCRSFAVEHAGVLNRVDLSGRLWLTPRLILGYLGNMVFPFNLKVLYTVSPSAGLGPTLLVLGGVAALAGVAFALRKNRVIIAGLFWIGLFLVPVIGFLPLGSTMMADRHAYLSLMGFALILAYLAGRLPGRGAVAAVAALAVSFLLVDWQRDRIWRDMPSLYTRMTIDSPDTSMGFTNLGMYHYEQGDLAEAEKYLEISCTKKGIVIQDALHYLSAVYWERGKFEQALGVLTRLINDNPNNPQPYMMASRIYEKLGDRENARRYHDRVAALFPGIDGMVRGRVETLCREGEKLQSEGKGREAERKFREALMMDPEFVPALIDMGSLMAEKKDFDGALRFFLQAVNREPDNPSVQYNLATVYGLMGRRAEAEAAMKRFQELDTRTPPVATPR